MWPHSALVGLVLWRPHFQLLCGTSIGDKSMGHPGMVDRCLIWSNLYCLCHRSKFYLMWNIVSVAVLWLLFEATVPLLEVLPVENFALIVLMTASCFCFYKVSYKYTEQIIIIKIYSHSGKTTCTLEPRCAEHLGGRIAAGHNRGRRVHAGRTHHDRKRRC